MTKIYFTFLLFTLTSYLLSAQNAATPNAGFEGWTQVGNHFDPNNWNTLNPNTSILGVFTCTRATGADAHTGSYAIKLTTKSVFGVTANGIASTATLVTTPPYGVTGGIPFTGRPDSIVGWYKYNPASSLDSGFMEIVLFDANNDTVAFSRFTTPNTAVTTYTRFSRPVNYYSTNATANSYWILTSSDGVNPVVNSALWVDDIDLIFNTSPVKNMEGENQIQVINTMLNNGLKIINNSTGTSTLHIIDNAGRVVNQSVVLTGENSFDLNHLANGIYFYHVLNSNTSITARGKIIKM